MQPAKMTGLQPELEIPIVGNARPDRVWVGRSDYLTVRVGQTEQQKDGRGFADVGQDARQFDADVGFIVGMAVGQFD